MSSLPASAPDLDQPRPSRRGGWSVIITWLVTRAIIVLLAFTVENVATGDVYYYWRKINVLLDVGLGQTLNEYPTPVVWILTLPYGVTVGSRLGYLIAFIALMLVLDGVFSVLLWRTCGGRRDAALNFWLYFVFLVGPLAYLRFDLVPAVLAGVSLLVSRRQPWLTGVLTGIGAAIKLWPALLIVPFAAYRKGRRGTLIGFFAAGFGLALISLIFGGLSRLFSPLTWQSDRGLQIESIWASGPMLLRLFQPETWVVAVSTYQAFEVFGPGVSVWLTISTVATVVGFILMLMLYVRAYRNGEPTTAAIGLVILATITLLIITNKTLSPQYLVWLGGPMAALLLMRSRRPDGKPTMISRFAIQLLVLALLTHLVYPLTYHGLYDDRYPTLLIISTILLVIRNLGLLIFAVAITMAAWRATGRRPEAGTAETI